MAEGRGIELVCDAADESRLASLAPACRLVRAAAGDSDFHLCYDGHRLALVHRNESGLWVEPREIRRRLQGGFPLGRACGIRRGAPQSVLDAMAGLGVDGLALALTGQNVHLVERHEALWALLNDLVARLGPTPGATRLTLGDSLTLLESSDACYDVVYLDPMFPPRRKTALPNKRMQTLAALLDEPEPLSVEAIELAKRHAIARVVLKRRARDGALGRPDWSIRGKAVRYDVYRGAAPGGGTRDAVQPSRSIA